MLPHRPVSNATPRPRGGVPAALLLLPLLFLGCAATVAPELAAQDETAAAERALLEYPTADAELVDWLEARLDEIGNVRKIDRARLQEVFRIVDSAIVAGEHHVENYPDSPRRTRALWLLGRFLYLNIDRDLAQRNEKNEQEWGAPLSEVEIVQFLGDYYGRVQGLIDEALALEPTAETRARLLELRGECFVRNREPAGAAEAFEAADEAYPGDPQGDERAIKLCEALDALMRFDELAKLARESRARWTRSEFWPHFFWYEHKAYRHSGRLEDGLHVWKENIARLEAGAKGEPIEIAEGEEPYVVPEVYRIDYQRYVDRHLFYRGFFQYALGNDEKALAEFRAFSDALHERINAGETLDGSTKAYLHYQGDPMARRMSLLQDQPLPEFGDEVVWITPPGGEPDPPKTVIRIFCPSSNAQGRHELMFPLLARLANEYFSRGLRIEWFGFSMTERSLERERGNMVAVARKNRLGWTMGIDRGPDFPLHQQHGLTQGGTTLILTNTDGTTEWLLIDPMYWDEGLIRRVLERVLPAEEAGEC